MPSRPASLVIILLWLVSTVWLIQRDILPALGVGEITYERALAARAVEEPVEWIVYRQEEEVGNLLFSVKPSSDSSCQLQSRARIRFPIPGFKESQFELTSAIHVNPLKRLDRFQVLLSLPGDRTEIQVDGNANPRGDLGVTARLLVDDKEVMKRDVAMSVDPEMMVLDVFGQIDRLPDLRPGKTWRTRFVNPLRAIVGGVLTTPLDSMDFVQNTVVGTETIEWNGEKPLCYKLEHRYQQVATHSWARVKDGKVLVQEVHFAGVPFRLVARPAAPEAPLP